MALPFIEGFGGLTPGATHAVLSGQMVSRGMLGGSSSSCTVIDGRHFYRQTADQPTAYIEPTSTMWVGFRLSNTSADVAWRRAHVRAGSTGNFQGVGLLPNGSLVYGNNSQPSTVLATTLTTVFVEMHIDGTALSIYLNGDTTPVYTGSIASVARDTFGVVGQPVSDVYVSTTRLGEGTARLLPNTLSVSAGTAGGAASSVADGLASLDDQTKYVTFVPTEKAQLSVADITDNPSAISAVSVVTLGRKSGTALLPELVTATTASENTIATPVLGVSFSAARVGLATDPHDSSTWTKAKINSLLVGVGSI